MDASARKLDDRHYTYADYACWPGDVRYELIDGIAYLQAAPAWEHQGISRELLLQLGNFLRGKPCKVFSAPFDVRLNASKDDDTVLQPDLVVICDRSKLSGTGCAGVPDMVIEILSPSSAGRDRFLKFNKYLQAGVREYWIVDPDSKTVSAHVLKEGEYVARAYGETDDAPVHILEGCVIHMPDVFAE